MANTVKVSVEHHEGDVVCMVHHNNQVFSGGADGKIKIWDNDLNLIKTVDVHEAYIYAMAVNKNNGKLYSSSCDGSVNFMLPPYDNGDVEQLFCCEDAIQSMYCDGDILYTGDEKGLVTNWLNDKMLFKFSLVEEVKSMAAANSLIYTVRDLDVVVSEVVSGKSGKYCNKAVLPGKSPLLLTGPLENEIFSFLAFADRTGKGLLLVKNLPFTKYEKVWSLPDCHEMIINSICGNDFHLYSGGYDGKVKGWSNIDQTTPKALGEVEVGSCVNAVCCGVDNCVYIGASDGFVRCAKFV